MLKYFAFSLILVDVEELHALFISWDKMEKKKQKLRRFIVRTPPDAMVEARGWRRYICDSQISSSFARNRR